jgi:hypothetical protein
MALRWKRSHEPVHGEKSKKVKGSLSVDDPPQRADDGACLGGVADEEEEVFFLSDVQDKLLGFPSVFLKFRPDDLDIQSCRDGEKLSGFAINTWLQQRLVFEKVGFTVLSTLTSVWFRQQGADLKWNPPEGQTIRCLRGDVWDPSAQEMTIIPIHM